jgi:hypothetical protein
MNKKMTRLNIPKGFSRIRISYWLIAAVLIILATIVLVSLLQNKSGEDRQLTAQKEEDTTQLEANPTTSPTSVSETTPNPTVPNKNSQGAPSQQPEAIETPISHPTAENCGPSGTKLSVYASVKPGTSAYKDHPIFRDNSNQVLYTVDYGTIISDVYCDAENTALFREVGRQVYARFNFQDVSTKPL